MAAVLTGTPSAVVWESGANPSGQSITIPSDATAVYMFWQYYLGSTGHGLASATLAGASPDQTFEVATEPGDQAAAGVAVWYNPPTGSQTLDPAWDSIPGEGPTTIVAYVKDGDTTAWRDADAASESSSTACSVTLTTESGDLVLKFDSKDGAAPANTSGWTSAQTTTNGGDGSRLAYISASGTSQACPSEDEAYSTIVAVAIPAAAGGATVTPSVGTIRFVGQAPTVVNSGDTLVSPSAGVLRFHSQQAPIVTLVGPEISATRVTGNNTASGSWAVGYPAYNAGDLILIGLCSDQSTDHTHGTLPGGPNSETKITLGDSVEQAEIIVSVWGWIATAAQSAGTVTVTPTASEQWTASAIVIPAGLFDPANPIQDGGDETGATGANDCPDFTVTLANARVGFFGGCDTDSITGIATGWQLYGNQDIGAIAGAFGIRNALSTASESLSGAGAFTGVNDGRVSTGFAINPRRTVYPWEGTFRFIGQAPSVSTDAGGATVNPSVGTLQFVGQTPTANVTHSNASTTGELRFVGQTPTVSIVTYVSPSAGLVRIDGQQPIANVSHSNAPTVGTLRFVGNAPQVQVSAGGTVQPLYGTLRFVGNAPKLKFGLSVSTAGALTVAGQTITFVWSVPWTEGAITIAGQSGILINLSVSPQTGTLRFVGQQPSVGGAVTVAPSVGTLRFVGAQPTANVTHTVAPTVGTVRVDGQQPTANVTHSVVPQAGTVRIDGQQPTIQTGDNRVAQPGAGVLRFEGQQPTANVLHAVAPSVGTLRIDGQQPTISWGDNRVAQPSVGALRIEGAQPTVTYTDHQRVTPTGTVLRLVADAPTVSVETYRAPSAGTLRLEGLQPAISQTSHAWASPAYAVLRIVGQQPSTIGGGLSPTTRTRVIRAQDHNRVIEAQDHGRTIGGGRDRRVA